MVGRVQRRKISRVFSSENIQKMLLSALKKHEDFVLAREPRPGETADPETEPVIHIMTGNLITSCRLNGLKGRVMLYDDEGARIVTIREKDLTTGPEK
ncbi:hypothetical protein [Methanoregula sp.]|jgi:IMP dehydrogenase/GMP reductase|uniref:hypothetical protein n=1 Tax=Methanoregula sp. TaxID=2052170 RepID=UPI0025E59D06|nr:hypothetical protein [Methanoregula sp.]